MGILPTVILTEKLTKKRLQVIWALWLDNAKIHGKFTEERPEIGKVLVTVQRAVDLPDLYLTRPLQVW